MTKPTFGCFPLASTRAEKSLDVSNKSPSGIIGEQLLKYNYGFHRLLEYAGGHSY